MKQRALQRDDVLEYVDAILGEHEHARRVLSISHAVLGIVQGASFAIHLIGAALAAAAGMSAKHATKQVDRLLSNAKFRLGESLKTWVRYQIGTKPTILVALDWTDYDADGHATICLALVPKRGGRGIPLMWRSVKKSELKGRRNRYEDELLVRFHEALPSGVRVTVTADRGFADQELFMFLRSLGFDYVIRIKGETTIWRNFEEGRAAKQWLRGDGRVYRMSEVMVTYGYTQVPVFVSVKARGMKAAWYVVSSRSDWTGSEIVAAYGKRFTIEEMFRDEKDWRFGLGLSATHIGRTDRRDRLIFLGALARDLLTLLGEAGESMGLDRKLKVNTVPWRTHSLYRQGCHYYRSLATMKATDFEAIIGRFEELLAERQIYLGLFGKA